VARHYENVTDEYTIVIKMARQPTARQPTARQPTARQPTARQYASAVLGCVTVLQLVGLADIATVWQDDTVVTDEQIGDLADHWADTNPWS
jgi:hypothetical protein